MGVVERAERDLARDEPWLARDRLVSALRERPGAPGLFELLGTTYARMHDLPAAGAAWSLSDRTDDEFAPALAALGRRYPKPQARALALPVTLPLSAYPPQAQERLRGLAAELDAHGWDWQPPARPQQRQPRAPRRHGGGDVSPSGRDRLVDAALGALAAAFVVATVGCWALGVVTLVRWLV